MKRELFVVFILAFVVRLIALDQSLWLDEAVTAKVVQTIPFQNIISQFSKYDFHPPLYYFFIKSWSLIFGSSEIALRLPSVFFSLLTGFVVYKIAALLKNKQIGLWSAVFFLFNPLIVYYSQEARMYMMAVFFCASLLYFALKSTKSHKAVNIIFANIFIALSIVTFYGSLFFIASIFVWLLVKKEFKLAMYLVPSVIIVLLALSPLIFLQLDNAKNMLSIVLNWQSVLGKATLKDLLLVPVKFTSGRIVFYPKWLYYAISGIWVIFITFMAAKHSRRMFILFLLPLILGFLVSFFTPMLQYFRFLYLLVILALLLGFNSVGVIRYVISTGFIIFSMTYLLLPQFHREDWKLLATKVSNNSQVYMIPSFSDPLSYYKHGAVISDIRSINAEAEKIITVIPYGIEIYGYDYKNALRKLNYRNVRADQERGVKSEIWSKD